MIHHLKIYPEHFSAVCTGVKRAELRKNDRNFSVSDTLHLMETPKGCCNPTGEFINVTVTHIADVGGWLPGYVLLSIVREGIEARTEQQPVGVAGFDAAAAIRACMEEFPESAQDIVEECAQIAENTISSRHFPPAPAPVTVKLPDEVLVLLNHLEDVLPSEAFELIDVKTWNAVSMLSATGIKIAEGE